MVSKFRAYSISITFLLIISFPLLNDNFNLFKDMVSTENRRLSKKPIFDVSLLDPYPVAFEKYYNDTFALRNSLIYTFNLYNIFVVKKSPYPDKVIIGKNKWLYVSSNESKTYQGTNLFTNSELEILKKEFETRVQYLKTKNCKFYIAIAPTKAIIYPENMPNTYKRIDTVNFGKQLINYLNKNSSVKAINLFNGLKSKKGLDLLYYKLDNHWNPLGAFYATNEIIRVMNFDFKNLKALNLNEFNIIKKIKTSGNIENMLGDFNYYNDIEYELIPKKGFLASAITKTNHTPPNMFAYPSEYELHREIKNSTSPKLLIFSDSFGNSIFPFLSENFSTTTKIFDAWCYILNRDIVEKEMPDAVIIIIHEPLLRNILNNLNK